MLLLNPEAVKFGSAVWSDVISVVIDRASDRTLVERSDTGPHPTLVDVPEQRVSIRVQRTLVRDTLITPRPGESAELVVCTSPAGVEAQRKRVRAVSVVVGVSHEVSRSRGALQTIALVAVSSDGNKDPLTLEDASDGVF